MSKRHIQVTPIGLRNPKVDWVLDLHLLLSLLILLSSPLLHLFIEYISQHNFWTQAYCIAISGCCTRRLHFSLGRWSIQYKCKRNTIPIVFWLFLEHTAFAYKMWNQHIAPITISGLMISSRFFILVIQPFRKQCEGILILLYTLFQFHLYPEI